MPQGKASRILIIKENNQETDELRKSFERAGHEVIITYDFNDVINETRNGVDVVLLDASKEPYNDAMALSLIQDPGQPPMRIVSIASAELIDEYCQLPKDCQPSAVLLRPVGLSTIAGRIMEVLAIKNGRRDSQAETQAVNIVATAPGSRMRVQKCTETVSLKTQKETAQNTRPSGSAIPPKSTVGNLINLGNGKGASAPPEPAGVELADPRSAFAAGRELIKARNFSEAHDKFRLASALDTSNLKFKAYVAFTGYMAGRNQVFEAQEAVRLYLDRHPGDKDVHFFWEVILKREQQKQK